VTRTLRPADVVVADERHAACLGGILGGAETAIDEKTAHLFLEAANWDPGRIRTTAKQHQVRTDASNRFEKNQSPFLPRLGIERFAEILHELQPGVTFSAVGDVFPLRPQPVLVPLRYTYVSERIGAVVPKKKSDQVLTDLGFALKPGKVDGTAVVAVPYYRATRDISIEDDLVEEVGRIYGYNEIGATAPLIASDTEIPDRLRAFEYEVRDQLCGLGFSEAYSYSFLDQKRGAALGLDLSDAVVLANPIDAERDIMRVSLVPAMVELIERNLRFSSSMALYEIGRAYHSDGTNAPHRGRGGAPARERRLLCLGLVAGEDERTLSAYGRPPVEQGLEFYAIAGVVRKIVTLAGPEEARLVPAAARSSASAGDEYAAVKRWMHPHRQATVIVGSEPVGVIAEVRPGIADTGETRAVIAEIDLERLLQLNSAARPYAPLPKFPPSFFEMSIVTAERTPFAEIDRLIRGAVDRKLIKAMEVTAVYRGAPLAEGEKSTSIRLALGSDDRTLGPEEIQRFQSKLMQSVEQRFSLRR
jgi:phenylalanyl-tRNA synthetase beta chain